MKKIILVSVCAFTLVTGLWAVDISYQIGDTTGARVGIDVGPAQLTVGLDYKKISIGSNINEESSYEYNYSNVYYNYYYSYVSTSSVHSDTKIQVSLYMPSIGVKLPVFTSADSRLRSSIGAEYFLVIPVADSSYSDKSNDGGQGNADALKSTLDKAINDYKLSGYNIYFSSEYFLDEKGQFSISGIYGLKTANFSAKSTAETHSTGSYSQYDDSVNNSMDLGFTTTYMQMAVNYHF